MQLLIGSAVSSGWGKEGGEQHNGKVQSNGCVGNPALNAGSDSDCRLTFVGWLREVQGSQPCHWMTSQTLKICHFLTLNLSIQWQKEKGEQFIRAGCLVAIAAAGHLWPGGATLVFWGFVSIQKAEGAAHRAGGCAGGGGHLVAGCEMSLLVWEPVWGCPWGRKWEDCGEWADAGKNWLQAGVEERSGSPKAATFGKIHSAAPVAEWRL